MFYKAAASSLLAVLPSLAAAQNPTQPVAQTTVQAQASSSVYRPGIVGGDAMVNRASNATTFTPSKNTVTPAVPAAAKMAAQSAVVKPAVAAVPAVVVAAPVVTAPAPTAAIPVTPATLNVEPDYLMAVDFRQGKLSVVAERAPLGKLLALVATKTGTHIDVAPEMAQEIVAAKLGPASASEVLSALLDGPKIEYIILGANNESGIQRVVVRRKQGLGRQQTAPVLQPPPPPQQTPPAADAQAAPADANAAPQQEDPPQHK